MNMPQQKGAATLRNRGPHKATGRGELAGGQYQNTKGNTKKASFCSFCDEIAVVHSLHREKLGAGCEIGTALPIRCIPRLLGPTQCHYVAVAHW
jgi:hypothetical protein